MKEFLNKVRDFFVACGAKIKELALAFALTAKNFGRNFFQTRKVPYYIAAAAALLAWIAGIICSATLGMAGVNGAPVALVTIGLIVFVFASILGHERIGTAAVGIGSLFAFVLMFSQGFEYFVLEVQKQAMTGFNIGSIGGLIPLIVCIAMFVVCAIVSNVTAFLKQTEPVDTGFSVEYVHDETEEADYTENEVKQSPAKDGNGDLNDGGNSNGN